MSWIFPAIALAVAATSFGATRIVLPAILRRARSRGHVDHPGGRKTQAQPVPYGGGLALLCGLLVPVTAGLAAAALDRLGAVRLPYEIGRHAPGLIAKAPAVLAIFAGALTMLVLGRLDDRHALRAGLRFLVQVAAAALPVAAGVRLTLFLDSAALQVVVSISWIVFVTNAFNFIDNMDGLACGVGVAVAATLLGIAAADGQWFVAAFALALGGALGAVWMDNRPPARIYLGDEGSTFLGFLFAALTIAVSYQSEHRALGVTAYPFVMPFLILAVPVADGLTVIADRLRRGVAPWTPGHDHLSHRLARAGFGPRGAAALLVGGAFGAGAAANACYGLGGGRGWVAAAMATMMIALSLRAWRERRSWPPRAD